MSINVRSIPHFLCSFPTSIHLSISFNPSQSLNHQTSTKWVLSTSPSTNTPPHPKSHRIKNKNLIPVFPSSISQPAEAAANGKPFFVYQYEGFGEPCPAQSTFETLDRKLDGETNIYLHDVFAVPGDREGHLPATLAFDESGNLMEQANNGQDLAIIRVMRENEDL